ncbi:MAG: methyltransferase [Desulfurellaceae bacterium]|nr:methyltransferase [Desulfurellaceae bacterium]
MNALVYEVEPIEVVIGSRSLTLLRVKDLERLVDREALLRDNTEEPPYWAHLWTGALTLARYLDSFIDVRDQTVLDLGCGLGLTGIVAAQKGGRVTFADKEVAAVSFARENARLNGCARYGVQQIDFTQDILETDFALILGAEILYDRPTFPALVRFLARHLSPAGRAILADAKRTNTQDFYQRLDQAGLQWTQEEVREREDHLPLPVAIVTIQRGEGG